MTYDRNKSNKELGEKVRKHLLELGYETPIVEKQILVGDKEKMKAVEFHIAGILTTLGLDLTDDSLQDTPARVAKMYVMEIFAGLKTDTFPKCTMVDNKFCHGDEFVIETNITMYSDCEHHIRPIIGVAHVAYIPRAKVLGLSKLNRLVQYFATRPQVQERLTVQIAEALAFIIGTEDVAVIIDAKHTCVSQRGIKDTNSSTRTLSAKGEFAKHNSVIRREFLSNIG